ncbi:MAG: LysR family transcriptional regulator [Acidobacteriota bacterium]
MSWKATTFDWTQIRAFLATVDEGSLSAAARVLDSTQPTVSRQVSSLERSLGVTLFERGARSAQLTEAGVELLEHARAMADSATRLSLAASGQSRGVEGRVTVTATELMATYHLPPILARLRKEAPGIEVEVLASNEVRDLGRREADIAVRHARPSHGDLVARRVGATTAHLFAATSYLESAGRPETLDELKRLDFVGLDQPDRMIRELLERGLPIERQQVKLYTSSSTVLLALVEQGLGVSIFSQKLAELRGSLERVLPELPPIDIPVWLVTHRELRTSRRIRCVWDLLAEELGKL